MDMESDDQDAMETWHPNLVQKRIQAIEEVSSNSKSSIQVLAKTILRKGTTIMEQYTGFSANASLVLTAEWTIVKELYGWMVLLIDLLPLL